MLFLSDLCPGDRANPSPRWPAAIAEILGSPGEFLASETGNDILSCRTGEEILTQVKFLRWNSIGNQG
ncbi:hypothetical protein AM228_03665 [Planktothricoides sp. SR001]|nr:hypothetical protein AM228_03665 [Planktothricoides sp. SR001]